MTRLLIVHHTPSPHCQEMFEAVLAGATDPEIDGVEVVRRPALTVSPVEMLEADGYLLGTPVNLGYISGGLKHAFDGSYYQLLDASRGRPFGLWLHGNEGTGLRAVQRARHRRGWAEARGVHDPMGGPVRSPPGAVLEEVRSRHPEFRDGGFHIRGVAASAAVT